MPERQPFFIDDRGKAKAETAGHRWPELRCSEQESATKEPRRRERSKLDAVASSATRKPPEAADSASGASGQEIRSRRD